MTDNRKQIFRLFYTPHDRMNSTGTCTAPSRIRSQSCYKILVVERSAESACLLRRFFELDGHEVAAASDGNSALAIVKAKEPDIVITCIGLLGLDGFELAHAIRESLPKKLLLIAYTSYSRHEIGERAKKAGFDLFLPKPASLDDFRRVVISLEGGSESDDLRL